MIEVGNYSNLKLRKSNKKYIKRVSQSEQIKQNEMQTNYRLVVIYIFLYYTFYIIQACSLFKLNDFILFKMKCSEIIKSQNCFIFYFLLEFLYMLVIWNSLFFCKLILIKQGFWPAFFAVLSNVKKTKVEFTRLVEPLESHQ